jgi:hypothetical protein
MSPEQHEMMLTLVEAQVKATSLRSSRSRFLYRNGFCAGFRSAISAMEQMRKLRQAFNFPREWYK